MTQCNVCNGALLYVDRSYRLRVALFENRPREQLLTVLRNYCRESDDIGHVAGFVAQVY